MGQRFILWENQYTLIPSHSRSLLRVIRSMTGFARCEVDIPGGTLIWELRALNNRYLDLMLRLPDDFRSVEPGVREMIGGRIRRGKVEALLRVVSRAGRSGAGELDEQRLRALLALRDRVAAIMRDPAPVSPLDILRWPDVVVPATLDADAIRGAALSAFGEALEALDAARRREGEAIAAVLRQRAREIRCHLERVRARGPEIVGGLRERLRRRLETFDVHHDAARVEQELAYLAQRADVEEEVDRALVHLAEAERLLAGDEWPIGRRLDFLMQELSREANTLGAKAVDAETSLASVDMKVAIEQMREQVHNIE